MLKMKLPLKKSKHKASDEEEEDEEERAAMCDTPHDWAAPGDSLHRETVYRWFVKSLGPANRLEFAYGLLDLCNPLELRFLGSCLEDLARRDCHYLRECENKANGLAGEPLLGDLGEPISRAKLIIYLALLNSGSREVASRLYRLLLPEVGIERVLGGRDREEDSAEAATAREELLLLFTMASLHPAFTFHQRVTLRERLDRLREAMGRKSRPEGSVNEYLPNSEDHVSSNDSVCHNGISTVSHKLQNEAVHIEKIAFKGAQRKRADKNLEYTFKVTWSDHSVTSVTKSHHELLEFLLMLPNELSREAFDETILRALNQGSQKREDRRHTDLEPIIRLMFRSPSQALLQNQKVYKFFNSLPMESSPSRSIVQANQKSCKTPELFKEDSSEASSQEEENQHRLTIYKKPLGKCPVVKNTSTIKNSPTDGLHKQPCEQNGETDWRKSACPKSSHSEHCINLEHARTVDNWNLRMTSREKTPSQRYNAEKLDGRSINRNNGVKTVQSLRTTVGKEQTLEVGSGHDTCGETSSESYSSPSSPRHDRRESFESEDEKERDTDSNSDESTKNGPSFPTFGTVTAPIAKSVSLGNDEARVNNNLHLPKYSHIPFLAPMHCMISNGSEKLDPVLISPGSVSSVREPFSQAPIGMGQKLVASATGESEKHIEILTPLPLPSTFLPRNCQPSNHALHLPVSRLKISSPQGPAETCTMNGSAQTGLALGTASGFISGHSSVGFSPSPSAAPDPITKHLSQVVGLNQVVPHRDGGAMPPPTNLKLVLPSTNLSPAPPAVPYPLPGATLASANTNVLNAAATTASSQPASVGIGLGQATVPPAVPTHTPGPAPSPSPALTHSTAQSDSTPFISAAVNNTSTNGTLLTPQPVGPGACGSCGRRCSCGNNGGAPVSYIYANTVPGPVYRGSPFLTFVNGTYLNQAHQSNGAQLPFYLTPYPNGLMHDPLLGGQTSYGMQQIPGYGRFFPGYQTPNVVASANGSGPKKSSNVSCYNCGLTGHYANDCKQPHMEANQQGNRDNSQRTCF
ncbi:hypothetical protein XENTR_v10016569 [Xenopus tropicalis]|uniref:Zcchc2 protein n=1 Tax=Xenopus tropicalis TaxID=8364 RepID=B0BLW2_XENTR|nr:zinc finger CCHC domain-containing protein 2 [Xenopus tropicalis]AAI58183.1 zcchc2 protein [Xenopus tropicalis]KAE8597704.1 hypothetical protein XENTR_v10016569 [Xenopus tropicalis]|eukprot:NP_001107693.1 zinc finger CCHC domain-containing protein 2 [Xenopus tropicalis]